jgi:hypothetical protein
MPEWPLTLTTQMFGFFHIPIHTIKYRFNSHIYIQNVLSFYQQIEENMCYHGLCNGCLHSYIGDKANGGTTFVQQLVVKRACPSNSQDKQFIRGFIVARPGPNVFQCKMETVRTKRFIVAKRTMSVNNLHALTLII